MIKYHHDLEYLWYIIRFPFTEWFLFKISYEGFSKAHSIIQITIGCNVDLWKKQNKNNSLDSFGDYSTIICCWIHHRSVTELGTRGLKEKCSPSTLKEVVFWNEGASHTLIYLGMKPGYIYSCMGTIDMLPWRNGNALDFYSPLGSKDCGFEPRGECFFLSRDTCDRSMCVWLARLLPSFCVTPQRRHWKWKLVSGLEQHHVLCHPEPGDSSQLMREDSVDWWN